LTEVDDTRIKEPIDRAGMFIFPIFPLSHNYFAINKINYKYWFAVKEAIKSNLEVALKKANQEV